MRLSTIPVALTLALALLSCFLANPVLAQTPNPNAPQAYAVAYPAAQASGQYLVIGDAVTPPDSSATWLSATATATQLPKWSGSIIVGKFYGDTLCLVAVLPATATVAQIQAAIVAWQTPPAPCSSCGMSCATCGIVRRR
jgi:D-alanyl-D-alanine dipeptidase